MLSEQLILAPTTYKLQPAWTAQITESAVVECPRPLLPEQEVPLPRRAQRVRRALVYFMTFLGRKSVHD